MHLRYAVDFDQTHEPAIARAFSQHNVVHGGLWRQAPERRMALGNRAITQHVKPADRLPGFIGRIEITDTDDRFLETGYAFGRYIIDRAGGVDRRRRKDEADQR